MAIRASFSPTAHLLSVFDDNADNSIIISRGAAGNILVNGGAVAITGGSPTIQTGSRNILGYLLSPLRRYRQEMLRER